jgi:hypothetical protein
VDLKKCIICQTEESKVWYKKGMMCTTCYHKDYYAKNKEKWKMYSAAPKRKEYMKEYWQNNKDKKQIYDQTYYTKHYKDIRQKQNEYKFEYVRRSDVKRRMNFATIKRQKRTKRATPNWVNLRELKTIYENCPIGYEVDHIIPLQNELVCGLHVPWNLQYLTVFKNRSKNNKFELEGGDK